MTVTRIVQLSDGEELISFDPADVRTVSVTDDPRRGLLERRGAAEISARRGPAALRSALLTD